MKSGVAIKPLSYQEACQLRDRLSPKKQKEVHDFIIEYCAKTPRYLALSRRKQLKTQEGLLINKIRELIREGTIHR